MPLLMLFIFMGCNFSEDLLFQENPDTFPGKWMLVETSFSAGAELEYNKVENGGYYNFQSDGSFTSVHLDDCGRGTYLLDEDSKLILTYDCDTKDSPNPYTFSITFKEDYFILSPLSIMCIEGCPSKFKKLEQ